MVHWNIEASYDGREPDARFHRASGPSNTLLPAIFRLVLSDVEAFGGHEQRGPHCNRKLGLSRRYISR